MKSRQQKKWKRVVAAAKAYARSEVLERIRHDIAFQRRFLEVDGPLMDVMRLEAREQVRLWKLALAAVRGASR